MIKGITITLYNTTENGRDSFNRPILQDVPTQVDNVLVAPSTEAEVLDSINLTGRRSVYTLGIPKGDTNDWVNKKVEFFGQAFRTIGAPQEGIEDMIPLSWNKKVRVENIDGNINES